MKTLNLKINISKFIFFFFVLWQWKAIKSTEPKFLQKCRPVCPPADHQKTTGKRNRERKETPTQWGSILSKIQRVCFPRLQG